jgi:hypothetical protein
MEKKSCLKGKKTLTFTAQLLHALCWKKSYPPPIYWIGKNLEPFRVPNFRPANPFSLFRYSYLFFATYCTFNVILYDSFCGEVAVVVGVKHIYI